MPIDLDALDEDLRDDEGIRLRVYDDATGQPLHPGMVLKGHPTIGWGRCLDTNGISREEAQYLFRNDKISKTDALIHALPWIADLDTVRANVLANMAFEMGPDGLLGFHDTLSAIKRGDYETAAREMLDSDWARKIPERAIKLSNRMRTGVA
jgi:lysozyme